MTITILLTVIGYLRKRRIVLNRILFIAVMFLFACERNEVHVKSKRALINEYRVNLTVLEFVDSSRYYNISAIDSLLLIKKFREFATQYHPEKRNGFGVAKLPELSEQDNKAMQFIKLKDHQEFERLLMLIFTRLYSAHLQCCDQSYELRRNDSGLISKANEPLVFEFNLLSKKYSFSRKIEFFSSDVIIEYLESHPYLLNYLPIREEYDLINSLDLSARR